MMDSILPRACGSVRFGRVAAVVWVLVCLAPGRAGGQPGRSFVKGFEKEKIRLLYCSELPETMESVKQVKDAGFNVVEKLHWKMWESHREKVPADTIGFAKSVGLKVVVGVWLPTGISDPAFAEKRPFGFYNAARPEKGRLAPDIYDGSWWDRYVVPAVMKYVELSREGTVIGMSLDLEIYQPRPVPAVYRDVCYCSECVKEFCSRERVKYEELELKDRRNWFARKGMLRRFRDFQKARLAGYVEKLRKRTDEINPCFVFALLPYRMNGNILNQTLAEKLGTEKAPVIIATEATYSVPAGATDVQTLVLTADRIESIHRYEKSRRHHYVLLPGFSVRPPNTPIRNARRVVALGGTEQGYWIWGRYRLIAPVHVKELLAPVDEFWRWFRIGNDCLSGRIPPPKEILPVSVPKVKFGPNLLPDPSFEGDSCEESWGGFPEGVGLAAEGHTGARSLRIETQEGRRLARLYLRRGGELKKIPVEPNTLYRISMWAKTTKFTGGWSPYCGVYFYDEGGKQVAKPSVSRPRYERDWELRSAIFLSPPNARTAAFHISVLGEGDCSCVDDVEFREVIVEGG